MDTEWNKLLNTGENKRSQEKRDKFIISMLLIIFGLNYLVHSKAGINCCSVNNHLQQTDKQQHNITSNKYTKTNEMSGRDVNYASLVARHVSILATLCLLWQINFFFFFFNSKVSWEFNNVLHNSKQNYQIKILVSLYTGIFWL